jgi:glycosyltransferase involved in cell wall biosynthesis
MAPLTADCAPSGRLGESDLSPVSESHVCFLSSEHPPFDKRVFHKEAKSLAAAGFRVVHLCPDDNDRHETIDGISIVRYLRRKGKLGRLRGLRSLYRRASGIDAAVYHCNEPDSWVVGVALGLLRNKKVVFDCHEYYPGQVVRWLPGPLRAVGRETTKFMLQVLGLGTDLIVLAKASVSDDFSWSKQRLLVILNTNPVSDMDGLNDARPLKARLSEPFRFVHSGVIRKERGSEQLLDAMAILSRETQRDFEVDIVGEFKDGSKAEFFEKASRLGVDRRIRFHGWLSRKEAFEVVRLAHAGLILLQPTLENNIKAMPHKLFDYMLAGLPVVTPDFATEIAQIVEGAGAGYLVDTSDPRALAEVMLRLLENPVQSSDMGARGRAAVIRQYNWEADAKKLTDAYSLLLEQPRKRMASLPEIDVPPKVHRLVYNFRSYSWLVDPRRFRVPNFLSIDRPIFLLGTQGGGLTLLSRMLRRHPSVISAAGNSKYWTSADEIQNVFGPILPAELTGLRYKVPEHQVFPAVRSWTYAARDLYAQYRRTAKDFSPELQATLRRVIHYCILRFAFDSENCRFLDKSQVFTVRLGLIQTLLAEHSPQFILVTRDPYISVFRAANGAAADMRILANTMPLAERLEICAEHYANSVKAVMEDAESEGLTIHNVRFEDLLSDPESTLRKVCSYVGLDFSDTMIPAPHDRLPIGSRYLDRWYPLRPDINESYEERLDAVVIEIVNRYFGDLIDQLGYHRR